MHLTSPAALSQSDASVAALQRGACHACGGPLAAAAPPSSGGGGLAGVLSRLSGGSAAAPRALPHGRRCHYDGWLYCRDCHSGGAAVIPARVLEAWDLAEWPVCDDAAEFLAATRAQPLLVVDPAATALFALAPPLRNVHAARVRVRGLLRAIRGADSGDARKRLEVALRRAGPRRYLLETTDRWSVQDLLDVAQGAAFARLPEWLQRQERWLRAVATSAVLTGRGADGGATAC